MKFKKIILAALLTFCLATSAFAMISGGSLTEIPRVKLGKTVPVKILADYRDKAVSGVIDVGTYTKVDDKKLLDYWNSVFDGNAPKAAACSSCIKPINQNGKRSLVMGRNMDLPNSHSPAYILRINEPGKYRSVNIGYITNAYETFDQIAETGTMAKEMYDILPYMVTDAMNEKGLILETNMRMQYAPLNCTGTNPGKTRICSMVLARYLADHCATIDDVLKTVKNLDVYTANSKVTTWHAAVAIMDATGRYGVLEFANNKAIWNEKHPGQTNFWCDKKAFKKANANCGIGRWNVLIKNYNKISSQEAMRKAMDKILYHQLSSVPYDKQQFDSSTEFVLSDLQELVDMAIFWKKNYGIKIDGKRFAYLKKEAVKQQKNKTVWTDKYVMDPKNRKLVSAMNNFVMDCMKQLPADGKKLSGFDEYSTISYVVDNQERVYHVQFFEQPQIFHIGLK